MRTRIIIAGLLLCFLVMALISCFNSKESKQGKNVIAVSTDIQKYFNEVNLKLENAVLEGDYETVLNYYAEDIMIVPNFQSPLRGKAAVREAYDKEKKLGTKFHSFNTKVEKMWEANDELFEYGSFGVAVSSNETKHPYAFTGNYFTIWEKQKDKSFLIKYMISNMDFNPCKDYY